MEKEGGEKPEITPRLYIFCTAWWEKGNTQGCKLRAAWVIEKSWTGKKDIWKVMEPTEFSSNKFKIFCLSRLARQRNWDLRPDTWQQPQEQMALPCVEGKRFKVKHKSIFNCAGDSWGLLYHFKPEKPSGWKFYLWRQRPPAECRHSLVTPVQCTNTCSHECPVQSGWSHTVCTALPNLLLWLHWRQQLFWQRPLSSFCPLWHRYQE